MPELVVDVCQLESPPKIIVLSVKPEEEAEALSAGADVFINMNRPREELLEALRSLNEVALGSDS